MTNDQFLFWLWGWFEINEEDPYVLDNMQLSKIVDHIKLVKEENLYTSPFIHWLEGALDMVLRMNTGFKEDIYDVLSTLIYTKLKDEFERKVGIIVATKDNPQIQVGYPYLPPHATCASTRDDPGQLDCAPLTGPSTVYIGPPIFHDAGNVSPTPITPMGSC